MLKSQIQAILDQKLGNDLWKIKKPLQGLSKETYVVEGTKQTVFLKFDVNLPPLKRLSNIGLAPKIIASGKIGKTNYIIQEFVEGVHPEKKWFQSHLLELTEFLKKYHQDAGLFKILSKDEVFNFSQHIQTEIKELEEQRKEINLPKYQSAEFQEAFTKFKKQSKQLKPVKPEPIHADPNQNNFLVTNNQIYLIDWDNVILSDPLRDLGLIVWWYIPKNSWEKFFAYWGEPLNKLLTDRLFWWVAARSLTISFWFITFQNNQQESDNYLKDFYTSLNQQDNSEI